LIHSEFRKAKTYYIKMASTLGLTTMETVSFPLLARFKRSDYAEVELYHKVNIGTAANPVLEKRKATLFRLTELDKELIADVIIEFREACHISSLNLNTYSLRMRFFRELLDDPFRSEFDDVRVGQANTIAGFDQTLQLFVDRYFVPTDLMDQQLYLQKVKKPFKLSVAVLASRLRKINKLMSVLNNWTNPYTDLELKVLFYPMMLDQWKANFANTFMEIHDNTVPFQRVIRYMSLQEVTMGLQSNKKRDRDNSGIQNTQLGELDSNKRFSRRGKRKGHGGGRPNGHNNNNNNNSGRGGQSGVNRGGQGGGQQAGACPFPGHHHSWSDCYGNPQSSNYRPGWSLSPDARPRNNGNNNNRNNGGGRGGGRNTSNTNSNNRTTNNRQDAHVNDERSAAPPADTNNNNNTNGVHWLDEMEANEQH
jgi:hypothetical protein